MQMLDVLCDKNDMNAIDFPLHPSEEEYKAIMHGKRYPLPMHLQQDAMQ